MDKVCGKVLWGFDNGWFSFNCPRIWTLPPVLWGGFARQTSGKSAVVSYEHRDAKNTKHRNWCSMWLNRPEMGFIYIYIYVHTAGIILNSSFNSPKS